tara:strand:+ start:50 stop:604 length:555 start_codon:yes stop_codon:yes gene_type:complete
MSGNAALAAAKRRRNPVEQQFSSNTSMPDSLQEDEPCLSKLMNSRTTNENGMKTNRTANATHPIHLLRDHDKLLFILERRLEMLEEKDGMGNGSNSGELENFTRNTNSELKLLKSSLIKQQKSVQELTTLVTSLRGTISNQNASIADLTDQLNSATLNQSTETKLDESDIKSQSTMKLDISETK